MKSKIQKDEHDILYVWREMIYLNSIYIFLLLEILFIALILRF
jgi:hypothetical protein